VERPSRRARIDIATLVLVLAMTACVLQPSDRDMPMTAFAQIVATAGPSTERAAPEHPGAPLLLSNATGRIGYAPHLEPLSVPGFAEAVVGLPWDATSPRPLVVVLHGLDDQPERHCEAWRNVTGARAFVLCPRGDYDAARSSPEVPRYTLEGGAVLLAHVDAAIAALRARYGAAVDAERPLLAGFSLGAWQAAYLAQDDARYSRVAMLEGGVDYDPWLASGVQKFMAHGGRRILYACGFPGCGELARPAIARLEDAGASARVCAANVNVGHRDAPPLQQAIRAELGWFVDGDARWSDGSL
jgi:predicted esterase